LAFLAGWAILRLLALVPILGGLIGFAASVFGLDALIIAIWRGRTPSAPSTRLTRYGGRARQRGPADQQPAAGVASTTAEAADPACRRSLC
jgi:hypothetical protein